VTLPSLPERRRKEIASLVRKKYRERLGQFVVEGLRSVQAALDAHAPLVELVVADTVQRDARVQALLAQAAVPAFVLPVRAFERLSAVQTSQGTLAVARATPFPAAGLAGLQAVLVLDGVQDPGNVGTVMRTAAWFGVDALLAGPGTADYYNPKVVRAAMGGLWDLHLAGTDDLAGSLRRLQAAGFGLYGADLEGTEAAAWQRSARPLAGGRPRAGRAHCDRRRLQKPRGRVAQRGRRGRHPHLPVAAPPRRRVRALPVRVRLLRE
jgi:TrmH family RNA methyltransferase